MATETKPPILLSGYYGFGNVGDEAVLAAICDQLRQQLPGVRLAALTSNTSLTHRYQGIKGYDRWNRKTVKQAVRSCGMMVFGGGSLLQDVTSLKSLLYYVLQFYLAKRYRKPIMVYCQGLGPLRTGLGRRLAKWALNQADVIAWRDQGSLALAKEIGVTKEMQVFCDPVLAWRPDPAAEPADDLPAGKKVAFCLRHWDGIEHDIPVLAALADQLKRAGYEIVFLPFQGTADGEIHQLVAGAMMEDAILLPPVTPQDAYLLLGQMDFVLAMRLHALVMAAAQGVGAAAFSYDPKVDAFCHEANITVAGQTGSLDPTFLMPLVEEFLRLGADYGDKQAKWSQQAVACGALAADLYQRSQG